MVLRRVIQEIREDDVFGRAAQLSYFLVFSLVPALLITTVLLGFIARSEEMRNTLLSFLAQVAPDRSLSIMREVLIESARHSGGGRLSFGIVTAVWAASTGMNSLIEAMNKAYEVREARPWWKRRILAVVLTVALSALTTTALIMLVEGERIGLLLADWFGLGAGFRWAWAFARWPSVVVFVFAALLIVYRFGPNVREQKWRWILPGAACAMLLWIAVSLSLRLFLRWFPSYGAVYGSMGAVLVLMLWVYLSSAAVLIGGELNSEIENSAAVHGDPTAKHAGEKAPQESDE
jgi:membrane protein